MISKYLIKVNKNFIKNKKNLILNNSFNLKGSPACGDMIYLKFYIVNNLLYNINYNIYGCSSAISVVYIFNKFILYRNIYKILFIKNFFISKYINLIPIKYHCSVLYESNIKNCIYNFKNNYIFNDI